jgi:indolepyruvate ferredoxin oxidoreductase alpha subunit
MFAEHICLTANEKINDITRKVNDLKEILLGNTAIALGAVVAGVRVAAGYPGTPSTEVLESVAKYNTDGKISVEWSTNEKAALEVAAGASWSGVRAIVTMKQVGLNVASDPLMSLGVIGTKGGMVIVVADDPGPISSQTEQDTRHFGKFANIPVLHQYFFSMIPR